MSKLSDFKGHLLASVIDRLMGWLPPVPDEPKAMPDLRILDEDLKMLADNPLAAIAAANLIFSAHTPEMAAAQVLNKPDEREQARKLSILSIAFTHAMARNMVPDLQSFYVTAMNHLSVAYHIGYKRASKDLDIPEAFRDAFK